MKRILSLDEISKLYEKYKEILRYEINVLGVAPTELRHLIGRLGELYCAKKLGGKMALEVNQKGFDITAEDKKISVKTTAQRRGRFIIINQKTLNNVDELILVQFNRDAMDFEIIFRGNIKDVEANWRPYPKVGQALHYEFYIKNPEEYIKIKKAG